jgi:serine/threonine-protein kinase
MSADSEREELLASLLTRLSEQAQRGEPPNLEGAAAAHPDLADELRDLWGTAQFAQVLLPASRNQTATNKGNNRSENDNLPRMFGPYELLEELGRGGMGVVYKARDAGLDRVVALKMILRGDQASEADLRRFQTEIQAVARLDHPNIVPVYETGDHQGQPYFTMRFVPGKTLTNCLAGGPLPSLDAARYVLQITRAVEHAHQQGVIHRDLKPSSVLVEQTDDSGEEIVQVTDFGLAKRYQEVDTLGQPALTSTGAIVGTPSYMAPEQVSGSRGKVGPASDVYSLGVILYELLTGRPPFQAPTAVDTMLLVLDQDPVRPRMLNPKVHPDLELICLKCLQKDPGLRYSSAKALADDLESFLQGGTLSVRSYRWADLFNRALRETPHAVVLENWGVLWMWHSLQILLQCTLTTWMYWSGVTNPLWYLLLWGGGLIVWGTIFWNLRKRGGPVLFIERQVAHVWGAAVLATIGLFIIEMILHPHVPVLTLTPILAIIAGMVFIAKAGMLSGEFYLWGAALFLTAVPMALFPRYGPLIFGVVAAASFFVPGLKYHRQRMRSLEK